MASKSKKSKKAEIVESSPVVPVVFLSSTSYGRKGSFGYIPEAFAEAWIDKGFVISAAAYVTQSEVLVAEDVVEEVEVEDEVISERESSGSESDRNTSFSDFDRERSSRES